MGRGGGREDAMGRVTVRRRVTAVSRADADRDVTAVERVDALAVEEPLEIRVGGAPYTTTMRLSLIHI